ncbi:MAG: hypothetical protein LBK94_04745 [Prevotellaceae bacterium]|nr:hypothetical protein [Prevotellaceae bacterium]
MPVERETKPVRFTIKAIKLERRHNILSKTNNCQLKCPVRDKMLVESGTTCISRGLPKVFHVINSAPRERYRCDYASTNISFLWNETETKPDRFQKPVRFTMTNKKNETKKQRHCEERSDEAILAIN